jgi:hypothetical protein
MIRCVACDSGQQQQPPQQQHHKRKHLAEQAVPVGGQK